MFHSSGKPTLQTRFVKINHITQCVKIDSRINPHALQHVDRILGGDISGGPFDQLRKAMTDIFEEDYTKQEAIIAFKEWEEKVIQSGLDCYDSFIKTLNSFESQIANY